MGTIYAIYNRVTDKFYIGQTRVGRAQARWNSHKSYLKQLVEHPEKTNYTWTKLYRSMSKHGIDNFEFIELYDVPNELLNAAEAWYIKQFDSVKRGYNMSTSFIPPTYWSLTDEQRANHRQARKDAWSKPNSYYRSEQYLTNLGAAVKKVWADPNSGFNKHGFKEKLRLANIGRKHTEETKSKLRDLSKGNTSRRKSVIINEVVYDTCEMAAKDIGVRPGTISAWIKNGKATVVSKQTKENIID